MNQIPVVGLAFANERTQDGFLRNLTLEMKLILRALDEVVQEGDAYLHLMPATTPEEIQNLFQNKWFEDRVSIFHYGGHAAPGHLHLENEVGGNQSFFSEGLARFLGAQHGINLIFLNACSTLKQAHRLVEEHIPAVIATSRKIEDELAVMFAEAFYKGLASGASIEQAFKEADGYVIARKGTDMFIPSGTRGLYWEEEPGIGELDLPWRLILKQEARWFPAQWRLIHRDKSADEAREEMPEVQSLEGQTIHDHLIYETLGYGTIGVVYRAQHVKKYEDRAIKVTYDIESGFTTLFQSMMSSFQALKKLDHPNIARVMDFGDLEDTGRRQLYFSMELLKGTRLDKMRMVGNADQVIALGLDLCSGLDAAHHVTFIDVTGSEQTGIVHGNLMTQKVFLDDFGQARIIDFMFTNLSRLSNVSLKLPLEAENKLRNQQLGAYFAPEVLTGNAQAGPLADIYAVGAILMEAYTGKTIDQWTFISEKELYQQVVEALGSASKQLIKVIYRATVPNPDERWQSAQEMYDDMLPSISWWRKLVKKASRYRP